MDIRRNNESQRASTCAVAVVALSCLGALLVGCTEPEPRSFSVFMEDGIARDGALARCNQDRKATERDIECANARRAASAIALREERAQREELERESERKLSELRDQIARRDRAKREAMAAALAAAEAAYEAQWATADIVGSIATDDDFPTSSPVDDAGRILPEAEAESASEIDGWLDAAQDVAPTQPSKLPAAKDESIPRPFRNP